MKEITKEHADKAVQNAEIRKIIHDSIDYGDEAKEKIISSWGNYTDRDEDIIAICCEILYKKFGFEHNKI